MGEELGSALIGPMHAVSAGRRWMDGGTPLFPAWTMLGRRLAGLSERGFLSDHDGKCLCLMIVVCRRRRCSYRKCPIVLSMLRYHGVTDAKVHAGVDDNMNSKKTAFKPTTTRQHMSI